ncbi:hypothetical protein BDZ97DRAFT_1921581 [Flammula alnicola]|nr:hypothetical protein BDZ97DRAFT_1921581 [Flammula alnicola]
MSYYYDECEYSEEPVYYAPESVDYESEPIYYDPDIYGNDSDQHSTGLDFDNGCEEPVYYDPSIYDFENGPHHFPEPPFDGDHNKPACSDHAEPLHMDDKTQPPEFQYEPEPAPIPRYNDLPQHYQDWHWLASILRQLQEAPTTYDDLPDDEWELAIAHDNQLFESRMADATTLMAILSISEANQQLRQPPHYLAHPKQQFST